MAVDAVLELDVSGALAAIDELSTRFDDIAAGFGTAISDALANLSTGDVALGNIDTSGITAAIDDAIAAANTDIIVNADASGVTTEINDAISGVDTQLPPIEIDTSDAVSSLEDLGAAAQDATGDIGDSGGGGGGGGGGLTGAVQTVSAASDLATGSLDGVKNAAGSFGPEAEAGATGAAVFGGALYALFSAGVTATGAEQQFSDATGWMGQQIIQMQGVIPGFSGTIIDLGLKLGTSSTAMYQSTAAIYQQGLSAGQSQTTMATYTDRIAALAANAVAMNPKLGDVDTVMNRLNMRIGTGGNFLSKYGISLDKNEIRMHAWAMGLQDGNGQISSYALKVAAADLATQKLGPAMKKHIEDGSHNATTQLKVMKVQFEEAFAKLGQPLRAPMMELMKEGMPVAIEFAKIFAELGKVILPLLVPVMKMVADVLKPIVGFLTSPIGEAIIKWMELANPFIAAGVAAAFLLSNLSSVWDFLQSLGSMIAGIASTIVGAFATAWDAVNNFFGGIPDKLIGLLGGAAGWLIDIGMAALRGFLSGVESAASAVWDFFQSLPGKILTFIAVLPGLLVGIAITAVSLFVSAISTIIGAVANIISSMVSTAISIAQSIIGFLANIASSAVSSYIGALTAIIGAAVNVASSMVSGVIGVVTGIISGITDIASNAASGFVNALGHVADAVGVVASAVGNIIGAVAGLVGDFANMASSAAQALVHGIVNGIKDGASAIGGAIKDMASNAWDHVKSAFGFGSPSRIMHEYGKLFVEGFVNGITAASPTIEGAVNTMTAAVQPIGNVIAGAGLGAVAAQQNPNVVRVTEQSSVQVVVVRDWAEAQAAVPELQQTRLNSFLWGRT